MTQYILDEHGEPTPCPDVLTWGRWLESSGDTRIVAQTTVGTGVRVSTVFLGLDYSHHGSAPLIYETMVFGGSNDGDCERYGTREQAVAGHEATVAMLKAGATP